MNAIKAERKVEAIAAAIRERICLAPVGEGLVLHEGELASEFGVSRTPIRQVLQRLAYEHLVHTRSGVGTIAAPLEPDYREHDLRVFSALLRAAACCSSGVISYSFRSEMIGLNSIIASDPALDVNYYYSLRTRFLSLLSPLIMDEILREACLAAHWRLIRWRISDFSEDPKRAWEKFQSIIEISVNCLAEADEISDVLNAFADNELGSIE